MKASKVFDQWPERYDQWFQTPIGKLIKTYETELILEMLKPSKADLILDAGCGTGVFTKDFIFAGAKIVGLDLSFPMLARAGEKLSGSRFLMTQGDMERLPFADYVFDKTVSVTAIEFIKDARGAVDELFRVTKPGGLIVVATLNSLSPWAERRKISGEKGHPIFQEVVFRSPKEMRNLSKVKGIQKNAIHFQKEEVPERAKQKEEMVHSRGLDTGAFLASCWRKPQHGQQF